jgi:hypothetical protein
MAGLEKVHLRLRLLEGEDARRSRIELLQGEVEKGFTGPATPWTAKDSDRIRKLVKSAARRKR